MTNWEASVVRNDARGAWYRLTLSPPRSRRRRVSRLPLYILYVAVLAACLSGWAVAIYTVYTLA